MEIFRKPEPLSIIPDQFEKQNRIKNEDIDEMKARMKQVEPIMTRKHWRRDYETHLKLLTMKKKNKTQRIKTNLEM